MTEDGIKIALTAEELELLKALAWNVGETSPAQFARRQLINALGAGQLSPQGRAKARQLGQDLRRLHEELKGFLAEASPSADGLDSSGSFEENVEGSGAWADTEAEPTVETTFSSPTRFSFGRMAPPHSGNLFPGYHRSSAHAPSDGDDDLEEMAGKAFAISPRLGTFEPPIPANPETFAPLKEENEELIYPEPNLDGPELVSGIHADPTPVEAMENFATPAPEQINAFVPSSPDPVPGNSFLIPKIDVPGLEPESALRFEGDPLVDLLDQELLKLVEIKPPVDAWLPSQKPGQNQPVQEGAAQNEQLQNEELQNEQLQNEQVQNERVQNERVQNEPLNEPLNYASSHSPSSHSPSSQNASPQNASPQNASPQNPSQQNEPAPNIGQNGIVSFAPSEHSPTLGASLAFYSRQEGGSLADQLLESASQAPSLDNAEMHQSLTDELVDWVQDLAEPAEAKAAHELTLRTNAKEDSPAQVSEEDSPAQVSKEDSPAQVSEEDSPAQVSEEDNTAVSQAAIATNSLFLSKPGDANISNGDEDLASDIAGKASASSATNSGVDDADLSHIDLDAENVDATKDSTVLPRPPKIKPVEISGNSPPRKRRS